MLAPELLVRLRQPGFIAGASAVVLAAAIATNALWLQRGHHHPSPWFATRGGSPAPDETLKALQTALKREGLYDGPIDGLPGPQTDAAIRSFGAGTGGRADQLATGSTPATNGAPSASGSAAVEAAAAAAAGSPSTPAVPPEQVAAVQRALSAAAYGSLTPDGVFGRQTREAIAKFQSDHGLPATGEITDSLMIELKSAGALAAD